MQLLIVDVEYVFGGNTSTQYYALAGDDMSLIYLEQYGRPVDTTITTISHMTIGPQDERSVASGKTLSIPLTTPKCLPHWSG